MSKYYLAYGSNLNKETGMRAFRGFTGRRIS